MRPRDIFSGLLLAALTTACGHEHDEDGKEWTEDELAELEARWGYEVRNSLGL